MSQPVYFERILTVQLKLRHIIVERYRVISENNSSLAECQSCLAGEAAGGGDFGLSYGTGSYISIIHWNFTKKKNATQILRSTCETNAVDHGKISLQFLFCYSIRRRRKEPGKFRKFFIRSIITLSLDGRPKLL